MSQPGFFDFQNRLHQLNEHGNPLQKLDDNIDFQAFRPILLNIRQQERKSNAGRKPYDVVLMFKILVLGALYNLADGQLEYQIRDRLSFMAFLGLEPCDDIPDEKTIWLFREQLTQLGLIDELFAQFDLALTALGLTARKGSIVDASIVQVPRQRNTREQNSQIKEGIRPASFDENPSKSRQKDIDSRWLVKNKVAYFGYKNHINTDVQHKLIRQFAVTDAATHDSQLIGNLLDTGNRNRTVYGDSAYSSAAIREYLQKNNYRDQIHRKGSRGHPLSQRSEQANHRKSKIRARVEHIFGHQSQTFGGTLMRCIGITRARTIIGLRNLVYNFSRSIYLTR